MSPVPRFETETWIRAITQNMANQERLDFFVVLPWSFAVLTFIFGKVQILYSQRKTRWLLRVSTFDLKLTRLQTAKILTATTIWIRKWFHGKNTWNLDRFLSIISCVTVYSVQFNFCSWDEVWKFRQDSNLMTALRMKNFRMLKPQTINF